jgi:hypothetical protein
VDRVERTQVSGTDQLRSDQVLSRRLSFVPMTTREERTLFDEACALLHYAGSCRRVGRLLRLGIVSRGQWVGGIVLGSTFPNLRPRDDAFGLTRWVIDWKGRGLASPWASENDQYWRRLVSVAARTRNRG